MNTDSLKLHLQEKIKRDICLSILMESQVIVNPNTGGDNAGGNGDESWWDNPWISIPTELAAWELAKRAVPFVRSAWQRAVPLARLARLAPLAAGAARLAAPALPWIATGLAGTAIGTGLAYGVNSAADAMDSDSWKTGGSRAKTQWDLMTGDREAWGNVRDAISNPIETVQAVPLWQRGPLLKIFGQEKNISDKHRAEIQADIEQQRIRNRSQIELQQELNKLKNEIERPNNPISEEEYVNRVTKLINDPKYKQNS
jgi:hypothetical protein